MDQHNLDTIFKWGYREFTWFAILAIVIVSKFRWAAWYTAAEYHVLEKRISQLEAEKEEFRIEIRRMTAALEIQARAQEQQADALEKMAEAKAGLEVSLAKAVETLAYKGRPR